MLGVPAEPDGEVSTGGFGTLDPATLDSALSVLDALQATGRQVGVISHVPALVERVGAHVRVVQRGGGRSEVIVA